MIGYFNPRAPRGARPREKRACRVTVNFNPRAPRGARRPAYFAATIDFHPFQSTRPARGATPVLARMASAISISIHAPRAGRDLYASLYKDIHKISIHAPRAGRDAHGLAADGVAGIFQSTRPARGATIECRGRDYGVVFQSTRPARGATS